MLLFCLFELMKVLVSLYYKHSRNEGKDGYTNGREFTVSIITIIRKVVTLKEKIVFSSIFRKWWSSFIK